MTDANARKNTPPTSKFTQEQAEAEIARAERFLAACRTVLSRSRR